MKRSKSFYMNKEPTQGTSQISLKREKTDCYLSKKEIKIRNQMEFDSLIKNAEELFSERNFEDALLIYLKASKIKPSHSSCAEGIAKCRAHIIEEIGGTGDGFFQVLQKPKQYVEKRLPQTYSLTVHDGLEFKVIQATPKDLKEYLRDRNYFKLKGKDLEEQRQLRKELSKKSCEKESAQRFKKQIKILEERAECKRYCDEQLKLITHNFNNDKLHDVVRFTENLIQYIHKKMDDSNKWPYVSKCYDYLSKACMDMNKLDEAAHHIYKLKTFAQNTQNKDMKCDSYILEGRLLVKQHKFVEAAKVWENTLPLMKTDEKRAWICHEIGRCYFEINDIKQSQTYGIRAAEFADKCFSNVWSCNAYILLAQVETHGCNVEASMEHLLRAQEYAERIPDQTLQDYIITSMNKLKLVRTKTKNKIKLEMYL